MSREEYNSCMRKYISGAGKTPEDRKSSFCIGAKICTGKAQNEVEALKLCQQAQADKLNEPDKNKIKRGRRSLDSGKIAECLWQKLDSGDYSIKDLTAWIADCSKQTGGPKIKAPETKKKWLGKCIKELTVTGSFQESAKLYKTCNAQYNEMHPKEEVNGRAFTPVEP